MNDTIDTIVATYGAAWLEPDPQRRDALLEIAWAETGTYCDPNSRATGRKALSDLIGQFLEAGKGARIELTSRPSQHHGHAYFTWRMVAPGGHVAVSGVDFGRLDSQGRLAEITGFFGPPPPLDPATE
jgi:hypothetical protein